MTTTLDDVLLLPARPPSCQFGLCRRPSEHQVLVDGVDGELEAVMEVCGLHVTPAIVWGRPEPLDTLRVRPRLG